MNRNDLHFSQEVTFGNHFYRRKGEVAEIILENPKKGIRKTLVDDDGYIVDFPGFANPSVVFAYCREYLDEEIRFRSCVSFQDGQYILIWQVQPDGRYWEDEDGFGRTSDDEIQLYAPFDDEGNFTAPFRLYSVGSHDFYGTDEEEKVAQTFAMGGDPMEHVRNHLPKMVEVMKERIAVPEEGKCCYQVPGTIHEVELSLRTYEEEWSVWVSVRNVNSNVSAIGGTDEKSIEELRAYLKTPEVLEELFREYTRVLQGLKTRN